MFTMVFIVPFGTIVIEPKYSQPIMVLIWVWTAT